LNSGEFDGLMDCVCGFCEGIFDGSARCVGLSVRKLEGYSEGKMVGVDVRVFVGDSDGIVLGLFVGTFEILFVG
jgi:hypothetical protein